MMRKLFFLFVSIFLVVTSAVVSARSKAIVTVSCGWCDYSRITISNWFAHSARVDFFVRTQGASTIGHTVRFNGKEITLYHMPVGVLYPNVKNYFASGTLIDPDLFFKELDDLKIFGVTDLEDKIRISSGAHLLMPYHKIIGKLSRKKENCLLGGGVRVGSGAAAADKSMGVGIRIADLMADDYKTALKKAVDRSNEFIIKVYGGEALESKDIIAKFAKYRKILKPYVRNGMELKINQLLVQGKRGIFEGAHGTFMDNTHGTYPHTSSCSVVAAGICAGAGVGPTRIRKTLGIVDVYAIHPGQGPFLSEIKEPEELKKIKKALGKEYKNNYRYGWIDVVMMRQAIMLNGIDALALNRLDLLDSLDKIGMCVDYDLDGSHFDYPPPTDAQLERTEPHYRTYKGWNCSTQKAKDFSELPQEARTFIKTLEALFGVPISIISVGPETNQIIVVSDFFS